ncbi:MAG TPA: hypothetical protein VE338_20385 [Ktedonobacterales bacterium]|jgi:hypothetical protein|nr:hypothetical protein [Ktedonobacterales bacterium]
MRRIIGYLLIAASVVAGVFVVFTLFAQWLGSGTGGELLLDGALLVVIFAVFCLGYYLVVAIER